MEKHNFREFYCCLQEKVENIILQGETFYRFFGSAV